MDAQPFEQWIIDLRFEIEKVYSHFELYPEHWRHDFDAGLTPAEAFDRIMITSAPAKAKRKLF